MRSTMLGVTKPATNTAVVLLIAVGVAACASGGAEVPDAVSMEESGAHESSPARLDGDSVPEGVTPEEVPVRDALSEPTHRVPASLEPTDGNATPDEDAPPAEDVAISQGFAPVPIRLSIPSAGIEASIEGVGRSEWPASDMDVGWFEDGARPGEPGNAVLIGHVLTHGAPAPGGLGGIERARADDLLTVRMSNGSELVYRITETMTSTWYDAPMSRIFGVAEDEQLNIISHSHTDPHTGQEQMTVVYSTRHTED